VVVKVWVDDDLHEAPSWVFPDGNEVSVNSLGLIVSRQQDGAYPRTIAGIRDWKAFSVEREPEPAEPEPEEETPETSEDEQPTADTPSSDEQLQPTEEATHGKRNQRSPV